MLRSASNTEPTCLLLRTGERPKPHRLERELAFKHVSLDSPPAVCGTRLRSLFVEDRHQTDTPARSPRCCSGCEDSQTSADAAGSRYQKPGGAMTTAFVEVVEAGQCSSYPHLMDALHRSLRRNHFDQRPLLSASQVSGRTLLRIAVSSPRAGTTRSPIHRRSDRNRLCDFPPCLTSLALFPLSTAVQLAARFCARGLPPQRQPAGKCPVRNATSVECNVKSSRDRPGNESLRLRNVCVRHVECGVQIGRQMRRRKKPRRHQDAFGGGGGLGGLMMGGGAALVGLSMLDAMF